MIRRFLCALAFLGVAETARAQTPTPILYQWFPIPSYAGGSAGNIDKPADETCICYLTSLATAYGFKAFDTVQFEVQNSDADDTLTVGIFSEDGQTQYFKCTFTITATGAKSCANTDAIVTVPEQNLWVCLGANVVNTQDWNIRRANGEAAQRIATETITCTAGAQPATWTPTVPLTYSTTVNAPFLFVTDD